MNDREKEIFRELLAYEANMASLGIRRAARPMDVGGSNRSHHSKTLMQMERKGWVKNVCVDVSQGGRHGSRRACRYESTEAGRAALGEDRPAA